MNVIEFLGIQLLVLLYLYHLIKDFKKPDNYEQSILVRGIFLVIIISIFNVQFFLREESIILFIWQSIKNIF